MSTVTIELSETAVASEAVGTVTVVTQPTEDFEVEVQETTIE